MNVLHVATINKPIKQGNGYGPIETVIFNIDRGLHSLGHRSIVACSSDSVVTGEHYQTLDHSLGDYCLDSSPEVDAQTDRHLALALERAKAGDIDVIHMHQWFERVYSGRFNPPVPIVMTLHVPGHHSGFAEFHTRQPGALASSAHSLHAVAISEYQRRQYDDLVPVAATVLHGIDVADYPYNAEPHQAGYLLSIGRITEDKGQDTAIAVAKRSGRPLILAGCVQNKPQDRAFFARIAPSIDLVADVSREPVTGDYYERVMQPILSSGKQIIYIGELSADATKYWYRYAAATLFPIRWGEPFGMVLIESMASGTPVLAFREGAVPEIVRDGETGFIVDSLESMVQAVGRISELDRMASRRHVKTHFSTKRMAAGYAALYEQLANAPRLQPAVALAPLTGTKKSRPQLALAR